MERGYIKLWRRVEDSGLLQDPPLLALWVWCLMRATYKPRTVFMQTGRGNTPVNLQPGEFITGINSAKELNMKPSSFRDRLKRLERMEMISIFPTSHYSKITIIKWDIYQLDEADQRQPTATQTDENSSEESDENTDRGPIYKTKKGRELSGKRLESFENFWEAFNHKVGKAEAADAWLEIPELTNVLCLRINEAARLEALKRQATRDKGLTPKMAAGWLQGVRWEDEAPPPEESDDNDNFDSASKPSGAEK